MKINATHTLLFRITLILTFLINAELKAQFKYGAKIEVGRMSYLSKTIRGNASTGPNLGRPRLEEGKDGTEINVVNGFRFREVLLVGVGVGYLNYEGAKGYSIYGDIEALTSKKKWAALFGFRAGTSNLKDYKKSGTVEFNTGVNYRPIHQLRLYLKGGVSFAYSSSFTALRLGVGF
ncbi:hypothetical protein [Pedobacter sp. Hv1]|uniref:hypothetical protein n=1 Tax=Pedobacter sp. Hv1 TaxID=1740090 RepID=UPI0006D8A7C0|nr:hypothetical protein [Pedobacter sp. Hv1]KQC02675.1 hypothetical protein AQF98_03620 [Pedobacter sp. Hv1]